MSPVISVGDSGKVKECVQSSMLNLKRVVYNQNLFKN